MTYKHYILFYDIADTKRKSIISKTFEDYGYRIQYSVFEMTLKEKDLNELRNKLLNIIKTSEDSLKIYELEEISWNKLQSYRIGNLINNNTNFKII